MLNRRSFLAMCGALTVVPTVGCNTLTLAQRANIIGTTAAQIVATLGLSDLSAKISAATANVVKAINDWKPGMSYQNITTLLSALLGLINLIPFASAYENLITVLIGAIMGIFQLFHASPVPPGTLGPQIIQRAVRPLTESQFRSQYNVEVKAHPEWGFHKI